MSIRKENSTLYVGLVREFLKAEWLDVNGKSLPTPSSTFSALLETYEGIEIMEFCVVLGVTDGYGNPNDAILFEIQCATEADAMSLQNDIDDWNEEQVEDCFTYYSPNEVIRASDWYQLPSDYRVSSIVHNLLEDDTKKFGFKLCV
jgi:hypothetical protein